MVQPSPQSPLYRLIEAGQLVRQALLAPLRDRGLEPGDDAVLFALAETPGVLPEILAETLGLDPVALAPRLSRLFERELVNHAHVESTETAGLMLTERGLRIATLLGEHWAELEAALFDDLKPKQRKALGKALKRFTALLRI